MDDSAKIIGFYLLLLFAATLSMPTNAATQFSKDEHQFLLYVKANAVERVREEKAWTENIILCLENKNSCRDKDSFQKFFLDTPQILGAYRSVLILGNYDRVRQLNGAIPTHIGYPALEVEVNAAEKYSELMDAISIRSNDKAAIEREWKKSWRKMRRHDISIEQEKAKLTRVYSNNSNLEAQKYYKELSKHIAAEFPYIPFISQANPTPKDYIKAMKNYRKTTQDVLDLLADPDQMPPEAFLTFSNIIEDEILIENPEWKTTYIKLSAGARGPEWTYKNWLDAFTSVFGIATNICFLFASIAEAWPIAIACGAAATAVGTYFLTKMTLDLFKEMKLNRAGLTPQERLATLSGRLMAMGIMFSIGGLGFVATVRAVEGTFQTALQLAATNLKTRFTNPVEMMKTLKEWLKGYSDFQSKNISISSTVGGKVQRSSVKTGSVHFPTYAEVIDVKNSFTNAVPHAG